MEWLLQIADIFFLVFHTCLTIFNLLGWMWEKSRKVNLITLSLTGASWFILGLFYGIGYCPLTDWHFQILYELGHNHLPASYIQYLIERISGWHVQADIVDAATAVGFFIALGLSVVLNIKDRRRQNNS
ncbi:MAG: DUF2784 family protein [Bacteroidales bacterium]